jgi:hypothetical protein
MMPTSRIRFYAVLRNTPDLLALYSKRDLSGLTQFTLRLLDAAQRRQTSISAQPVPPQPVPPQSGPAQPAAAQPYATIQAVSAPSLDWRAAFVDPRATRQAQLAVASQPIVPDELVIAYEAVDQAVARSVLDIVALHRDATLDMNGNTFLGGGIDPGNSITDHWCPGTANLALFGHRGHARRTIRAEALTSGALFGQTVNVVIIDEGLDKAVIPTANWGGGLDHYLDNNLVQAAGTAPYDSHGMMIARSILDLAPQARLYDVPMISSTNLPNIDVFVSIAQAVFTNLIHEIHLRRMLPQWSGPWLLVNAWGVFDTATDPTGSYTENKEPGGHPMINLLTRAVQQHHLDIVFAAGNCGLFCPSERCGGLDRGPGHSIWGANAHPLVITAGAVRADETWVGYSSQGPGPAMLAVQKPDLCAPSQFCETLDANALSSGTSAACAMTAGVVAALRGNPAWDQVSVTPEALRAALIASARKPVGPPGWDDRTGAGILDVAATIAALPP